MNEPIRVFIGTEPKTEIARIVLEDSIRKHATTAVEVTPMIGPEWEYSLQGITVGTGFSLRRWMIPAACGWKGKAIYMDADQLVFGNVVDLMSYHPDASVIACSYQPDKFSKTPWPQTAVMTIDCEKAKDHWGFYIDKILAYLKATPTKQAYADFMHATWLSPQPGVSPIEWNHLNEYVAGRTKLLHYTKEDAQPWYKPDHPLAYLWCEALQQAIQRGLVTKDMFTHALSQWGVKQDWRNSNGLHPYYRKYLSLFPG